MFRNASVSSLRIFALGVCAWALTPGLRAQMGITGWTLSVSDAPDATEDGIKYRNSTFAITSFSTASTTYDIGTTASLVFVRRNTDSNNNGTSNQNGIDNVNRSSVWNTQYNGDANRLLGTYESSLGDVLLNNNAIMGADNVFLNAKDPAEKNAGNIERVDFYFGATSVNANEGLTIFDRGLAGAHDGVKIALITSWGGGSTPVFGGNVVTLNSSSYGNNLDWNPNVSGVQDSMDYTLLRFNNGDNLTVLDEATETNTQGVAGSFISFANFGISSGTTIYGYAIMATDVVSNNVSNLADWRNAAYYPTGTMDEAGGVDLMSFNGRIARPVPEPSTYGALLLGGCVGVWLLRRNRRGSSSSGETRV
jgi:hypothetical protein